ncbi:MAG: hypothetical protein HC838_15960 [Spirulinaceae cyanobacterium RM2_2_10]|nr:hypothetical protein [Spirulinaceae cyanobacterium SM2_1_0]NJO21233.1 hypothetical protein [Spirulinaceae cyanobacterium RM2_2_10]
MSASEEFQKQLRAGNLADALTLALSQAIELEIKTWVSSESTGSELDAIDQPAPGYGLRTRINLIDGDIENEVGSQFIGDGPYRELRDFHLQQVLEGREIIQKNLENLQRMFAILAQGMPRAGGDNQPALPSRNPDNLA